MVSYYSYHYCLNITPHHNAWWNSKKKKKKYTVRKFSTDIPLALTAKRLVTINNRVEHTKIESSSVRNKPVVLIKARMTDSSLFSMFK